MITLTIADELYTDFLIKYTSTNSIEEKNSVAVKFADTLLIHNEKYISNTDGINLPPRYKPTFFCVSSKWDWDHECEYCRQPIVKGDPLFCNNDARRDNKKQWFCWCWLCRDKDRDEESRAYKTFTRYKQQQDILNEYCDKHNLPLAFPPTDGVIG